MKNWVFFLGCIAAYGQQVTISDTLTNSVGGGAWTGRITISLNSPSSASPLYYSTTSLAGWQYVLCVGVTGSDCSATTAAGVVTVPLYANSTITPAGTSYNARYAPTKGSPTTETWTVTASSTKLYQIRATTVPTPTTTFQASQIIPGSNGQVLTTTAGASAWGSVPACATCVVTSGSYADPAWITSLAGSKVSGNISGNAATATALAANGANCAAGTFPLGVDASGAAESCTALPTTISGTANQITASASTGAVTLSIPTNPTMPGVPNITTSNGIKLLTAGSPFTLSTSASTFNAVRDDLGRWGYNVAPGSNSKIDAGEPKFDLTMEANYYDLTNNFFEFNWNWMSIDGLTTRRPLYMTINRATNQVYQVFSTSDFNIFQDDGTTPTVRVNSGATNHNFEIRGGSSQSSDFFDVYNYGATVKHFSINSVGKVITLGNPSSGGGNIEARTNQVATSNTTHKPSPSLGLTASVWDGSQAQAWGVTQAAVGVSGTNGAYLWRVSSDYYSSLLDIRADNAAATFAGSVTATGGFTGSLTGNASTATALASTVASGRLWIGQGTGVPTSSANLFWDISNNRLGIGTASPTASVTVQGGNVLVNGGDLAINGSNVIRQSGSFPLYIQTDTANPLIFRTSISSEKMRITDAGTVLIGTTTDLGYGLHAANKGTNGNLLVFDPTATTGTTKAVVRAGAGQSGNIFEVQNSAGAALASIASTGFVSTPQVYLTGDWLNLTSTTADMASGYLLRFSSTAAQGGTKDLSLSRASAGVLQVGDGGANANGKIAAAVGLFGGAADAGFKLHVNATAAYTGDTAGAFILTDSATPAKRLYMGYDASADVGFINSVYSGVANKPLALNAAGGNVLIGTVTDLGYGLHASKKGTNGNLLVYDPTATTGNTKEVIRAGAGQSTNLTEWQNNAGTVLGFVRASDGLLGSTILSTADIQTAALSNSGNSYTAGLNLKSAGGIGWSSTGNWFDTKDTGLARNAAGVLEVNNGTAGTYRDLRVRSVFITQSTPAASTDACTAGALWADATYIYACTASGTIKRATLATF